MYLDMVRGHAAGRRGGRGGDVPSGYGDGLGDNKAHALGHVEQQGHIGQEGDGQLHGIGGNEPRGVVDEAGLLNGLAGEAALAPGTGEGAYAKGRGDGAQSAGNHGEGRRGKPPAAVGVSGRRWISKAAKSLPTAHTWARDGHCHCASTGPRDGRRRRTGRRRQCCPLARHCPLRSVFSGPCLLVQPSTGCCWICRKALLGSDGGHMKPPSVSLSGWVEMATAGEPDEAEASSEMDEMALFKEASAADWSEGLEW